MLIQGQFSGTAPLATGHPFGLPEVRASRASPNRVAPVGQSLDPDAGRAEGQTPGQFWRAQSGAPQPDHVAPPSIMQMRIAQMLEAQRESHPDPAEAERPREDTPSGADRTGKTGL